MPCPMPPDRVLDAYYLDVRCKLLEIAAIFDRLDRSAADHAAPAPHDDARLVRCRRAIDLLQRPSDQPNRAELMGLIFSDPAE